MQSIPLTEEQKDKLLEMAKFFFPEHMKVTVTSTNPTKLKKYTEHIHWCHGKTIAFPYKDWGNVEEFITSKKLHWFEFCLTKLANKLLNQETGEAPIDVMNRFNHFFIGVMLETIHPVDYLYKQFKTIQHDTTN
jgi:hypothetical protein